MTLPGSRTLWEEGHEPGREMIALGVALALTVASFDLVLTDHIGVLFDAGFLVVCLALALAVRPRDFFTVGVMPPLLMLTTFLLLAMSRSEALTRRGDGLWPAVLGGLSDHAWGLALGYVACLGVLRLRRQVALTRTVRGPRLPA